MRSMVLIVAAAFLAGLFLLTVFVMFQSGINALTLVSLAVIAVLAVGIIGALLNQPED